MDRQQISRLDDEVYYVFGGVGEVSLTVGAASLLWSLEGLEACASDE
jgi:hypothetical protein